jgi:hypothetical protein
VARDGVTENDHTVGLLPLEVKFVLVPIVGVTLTGPSDFLHMV